MISMTSFEDYNLKTGISASVSAAIGLDLCLADIILRYCSATVRNKCVGKLLLRDFALEKESNVFGSSVLHISLPY